MQTISVKSHQRCELIDVTSSISNMLSSLDLNDGWITAFVPHTTAAITINENADPDVVHDILFRLDQLSPRDLPEFRHAEGNSDAHIKASLIGSSVTVMVENGRLCLGTWQGIYFCEFDGPRNRKLWIKTNPK